VEDLAAWEDNPISRLIVQRLRRRAASYRYDQSKANDEFQLLTETLKSEGLTEALEVIEIALKSVRDQKEE
jgi:hypothetical protein